MSYGGTFSWQNLCQQPRQDRWDGIINLRQVAYSGGHFRLLRRIEEKINLRKRDEIHRNRVEKQCKGITLYKNPDTEVPKCRERKGLETPVVYTANANIFSKRAKKI